MKNSRPSNSERIVYLDSIRSVAAFMVVGIHTMGYIRLDGIEKAVIAFLIHTVAVPIFFLVDGVLFSKQLEERQQFNYWHFLTKSSRRLLIPWAAFSIFYLALRILLELSGLLSEKIFINLSYLEIAKAVFFSNVSNQMYFLLSLFLIRTFAFAWFALVKSRRLTIALIWFCYTIFVSFFHSRISELSPVTGLDPFFHAFMGLRFYLFGFALSRYEKVIKANGFWILTISFLVGIVMRMFLGNGIHVQIPLLLSLYVAFLAFINKENMLSVVGRFTMGVYLLHCPIFLKGASMIVAKLDVNDLLRFTIVLIVSFVVSLMFAKVLHPFATWRFVIGERH